MIIDGMENNTVLEKAKNLKEFKTLILKYESITQDDIDKAVESAFGNPKYKSTKDKKHAILSKLTGFGKHDTCTLCNILDPMCIINGCSVCAWVVLTGDRCFGGDNAKTYEDIWSCVNLKSVLRQRAKHMRKVLKETLSK